MGELRWILLGLGILSIGAIWWWGARRSGQTPGNAELREPTAAPSQGLATSAGESARSERWSDTSEARGWGIPPLEPLSIRTARLEQAPALDEPMSAHADAPEPVLDLDAGTQPEPAAMTVQPPTCGVGPSMEHSDRHSVEAPQAANSSETQKIVTVRVCAVGEARWRGTALMAALESLGLAYGQYHVYHRKHSDGRSIFCVASLLEPGTFDARTMADEEFRGVTFFAVLPGPLDPVHTVDALLGTARELARELSGTMQDARGMPFSPQRAAALRQDVVRFQALPH